MYYLKKILFILVFTIIYLSSYSSQCKASENDLGLWTPIYINAPINKKITTQLEINPRIQKNITDVNQLLIRPSIGYKVTDHLSIWQGYAWITNYIPGFISENRVWQQILYERKYGKLLISNRSRLEERFIENVSGASIRFRNMFRFQYDLDKNKKWSLVTYDEPFINIGNHFHGPQSGIDQNRFFLGLNRKLTSSINVEGGYLMQYINITSPTKDKLNHNILVNLYITLPQLINKKDH